MWPKARLSIIGLVIACALYGESLRPVLLPLSTKSQIIFSGIVIAIGYDIGLVFDLIIKRLGFSKNLLHDKLKYFLLILVGIIAIFVTWNYQNSQQAQRTFLKIENPAPNWFTVLLGSLLTAWLILQIGIFIRAFARFCASRVGTPLGRILIQSLVWIIIVGVGYLLFIISIFVLQVSLDVSARPTPIETKKPTSMSRSGGPGSLVSWDELGRTGREFVSREVEQYKVSLQDKPLEKTMDPIRIYAGIDNEPNLEKRVELIMREFERTKAYERSVVILFTPSGSGWVNPVAVEAVELITKGNAASVSLQYSNNQAFVQYIRDREIPGKASALLFSKIRERLDLQPANKHPKFYIYGESLGSLGSQEIFKNASLDKIEKSLDGGLWVGSPASGPLWSTLGLSQLYGASHSSLVRVGAQAKDLTQEEGPWGPARLAFLFNPTDPIVWSDPQVLYRSPKWLKEPRSPEISKEARWSPVLTFGHLWFEFFSTKNLPSGVGHNYDHEIPCATALVLQTEIEKMCQAI